jgi:hypothetical protein
MPYTMQIFPDENTPAPKMGDTFVVEFVTEATDMHWGKCIHIELKPIGIYCKCPTTASVKREVCAFCGKMKE